MVTPNISYLKICITVVAWIGVLLAATHRSHPPVVLGRYSMFLDDLTNELTSLGRELFGDLARELAVLNERISQVEARIKHLFAENEVCQRLAHVEGVGPLIATAVVASVSDPRAFKNGRQLAAWLGLVPRQRSSGNTQRLLGISKRGDRYLRTLLIHGARAVVARAPAKTDTRSRWIVEIQRRRGTNRTCVAVANKNARILWPIQFALRHQDELPNGREFNPYSWR
jgi:transposase